MTATIARPGLHREDARPAVRRPSRLRSLFARLVSIPVESTKTIGRAVLMLGAVLRNLVRDVVTFRFPGAETVHQCWSLYKVTAMPALLMAIPFGGMVAVQSSGLINQVGAASIVGAASGVGVVRQGAPLTAGLLMGGAAASAIASDLGARAIREELDAYRVMGVDPVRALVVPRFVALILLAPVLMAVILASAVLAIWARLPIVTGRSCQASETPSSGSAAAAAGSRRAGAAARRAPRSLLACPSRPLRGRPCAPFSRPVSRSSRSPPAPAIPARAARARAAPASSASPAGCRARTTTARRSRPGPAGSRAPARCCWWRGSAARKPQKPRSD